MQVDERVSDTLGELRSLRIAMESGEPIDPLVSEQLMARIQELVPLVSRADVELLKSEVDGLIVRIAEEQRALSDELKRLQKGRKGLDGYNHIRGFDTEQRLSRTA